MLAQQVINAISLGGVYALFALGFTLIFGVLGIVNLAHGAVFMIGAYSALQAVTLLRLPLTAAILAAIVITGAAGWLLDKLIFAPLRARDAPHLAPMIATIGLAISLNSSVEGFFGAQNLRFPVEALPTETLSLGGVRITWLELQIVLLAFVLMGVLIWCLKQTRIGRALRGLAESPKAAALLGIDVEGLFRLTSVLASLLGGLAGVLIALYTNAVFPLMGQPMLHKGIAVVILGGMGDIRGALLGGFFLGFAEVFSVAYIGSTMRDAVAFGLLFAIL
ncbi:MAG: branched-chain amino acid ABC transporter permease, partial [Candidatus Binatia bacterium]